MTGTILSPLPTVIRATLRWLLPATLLASALTCNSTPAQSSATSQMVAPSTVGVGAKSTTAETTAPMGLAAHFPASTQEVVGDLRANLAVLASDEFEGRGVGTRGIDKAADLIASEYKEAGLKPLPGMNDYFQRFEMTQADGIDPKTKLMLGDAEYALGKDFTPLSFSGEGDIAGAVAFVGYGITRPENKYDDYANIDVKGKLVIAFRFEPHDEKGRSQFVEHQPTTAPGAAKSTAEWSNSAPLAVKCANAAKHGAVALLLVTPPNFHGESDDLMAFARQFNSPGGLPVLHISRNVADAWLKQAEKESLSDLQAAIDGTGRPRSIELPGVNITGSVAIQRKVSQVKNVIGMLPGKGPHADEFVIVGAHYDHLGYGGVGSLAPRSHDIHHGADDNGSGTTSVLELAREFGSGPPLERSVVFVTFTGEEMGLIGSQHFVSHPPLDLSKVAAMLNLDMVGRMKHNVLYIGGEGTAQPFDSILEKARQDEPLVFKDIGRGGRGPSDHMSFSMKQIPVLFFFTGLHPDYHRPSDTADKIDYDGMERVVEVSAKVIREMAAMPKSPYVATSDGLPMQLDSTGGGGGETHVQLGVIPAYGEEAAHGVKISGTVENSPAAAAGLKGGDILIGYNDAKLDSLYDLSAALSQSKPGDKVKLRVKRDSSELSVDATLVERK